MIKDKDINSLTIAKFFLTKKELTPKKIQKLVYYAYSWFSALNNEDANHIDNILFSEVPEAWLHGPVFPSLYQEFKSYNWNEVPKIDEEMKFENDDLDSFLNDVWNQYGIYSTDQLEYMTHQEIPWINARNKSNLGHNKIDLKDIFNYYNEL